MEVMTGEESRIQTGSLAERLGRTSGKSGDAEKNTKWISPSAVTVRQSRPKTLGDLAEIRRTQEWEAEQKRETNERSRMEEAMDNRVRKLALERGLSDADAEIEVKNARENRHKPDWKRKTQVLEPIRLDD